MSNEELTAGMNGSTALAVCPRKKNDKAPTIFYEDRLIFKGETILYSNIDTLRLSGTHTTTNVVFENFTGSMRLNLKDKRKIKWHVNGWRIFGIGRLVTKKGYYGAIYNASIATVAKALSANYINQIKNLGGTVTVGGLTVSPTEVSGKNFGKHTYAIADLDRVEQYQGNVLVFRKDSNRPAFTVSLNTDNAACLLYILSTLISDSKAATAPAADGQ